MTTVNTASALLAISCWAAACGTNETPIGPGSGGTVGTGGNGVIGGSTTTTGGAATGGKATGGTTTISGGRSSGGAASGGVATGGKATGGAPTGGKATGGSATGGSGASCALPTSFRWSSTGPIIAPVSDSSHDLVAIKDPTVVFFQDRWHVYASSVTSGGVYGLVYLEFHRLQRGLLGHFLPHGSDAGV